MKSRRSPPAPSSPADGLLLAVRIQPKASRNGIHRMEDGTVKVRLTAPPVDGAANEALIGFLAQVLRVSRSQVEILSGHTARQKLVRISGASSADLERVLNDASK